MHVTKSLAIVLIVLSVVAQAQESSKIVRQTFTPDEFARFAPRTALDMARQVPGFTIDEGDSSRGFGQASTNLLINGRRISGKSNGPVDALSRVARSCCVHITWLIQSILRDVSDAPVVPTKDAT